MDKGAVSPETSFNLLKTNTVEAIRAFFPVEGHNHRLELVDISVDDKLSPDDIQAQLDAKDKEATWGVPIKASLKLIDKATGHTIDSKKNVIVARLPKLTSRFGFLVGGNEYQVDHLLRLKSGAYARVRQNGELETEFNLAKSPTGQGFSVHFDPKKRAFSLRYNTAHLPLYPFLKSLGVADAAMEQAWGPEIYRANIVTDAEKFEKPLLQFYKKTHDASEIPLSTGPGKYGAYVSNYFDQTKIRPDTTKYTLGKPFEKVDGEAILLGAKKILGVARGTEKQDDRDSLVYKEVAGVEDFIPERLAKLPASIKARIKNNLDHKDTIAEVFTADIFNKPIHEFFVKGFGVSERSDQTNPITILSAHRKTSLISDQLGGIQGERSITQDMHALNASHIGFLDPAHTPEGMKIGISMHLANDVRKTGKDLELPVFDLKAGKPVYVNVATYHHARVVLPDQVRWDNGKPISYAATVKMKMPGGEVESHPFKDADYVSASAKGMFDFASNLVPFLDSNHANRVMMADKQMEQAISLKHREAPLVQCKTDNKDPEHTFEKLVGHFTVPKSPVDGTVVSVTSKAVTVKDKAGEKHEVQIYDHFPLNDGRSMLHSTPIVKEGDHVSHMQALADDNFTVNGTLAIGKNLQVGYMPFKGYNYDDGVVISESAAKKMISEHLHLMEAEIDPQIDSISLDKFKANSIRKASLMTKEQWDNLGADGVIKEGVTVKPGQVLVAIVGKAPISRSKAGVLAPLGARAFQEYKDKSLTWDSDHAGKVIRVVRVGERRIRVYVKTEEPMVVGDKISGRHGNKGIISAVLPDHEMPFTKLPDGTKKPVEVVLNPLGIASRINIGQVLETAAAKVAEKTGKPFIVNNFSGPMKDNRLMVENALKAHGITDMEHIYDPNDPNKPLGKILVGPQYIVKMKQQVEKKSSTRGGGTDIQGDPYPVDTDKQPVKGGHRGGQGFGQLDMYALLGHGAKENIREFATYKSDQQDAAFWNGIQEGHEPPPPHPSFAYEKFTSLLKGMGVDVRKEGTSVRLLPLTDAEILKLADNGRNRITRGDRTILAKNLKEEVGGLFDPNATGGMDGDRWSFLRLATPLPNPIFVGHGNRPGPVPVLLGMSIADVDEIVSGKKDLNGKTGGQAIEEALKKVNIDEEISKTKEHLKHQKGALLDRTNRKLKYLLSLKDLGMRPEDAYVLHNIPIVPPKFRPVSQTPRGDLIHAPLNGLYRQISIINDNLEKFDPKIMSHKQSVELREALWNGMKAMEGIGSYKPLYDTRVGGERALKSISDVISGDQPKSGYVQSKLVKRRVGLSMRTTITPEPSLSLDQVGLPRHSAMELYKPFVVAQLHRWGQTPLEAQTEIKGNTELANKALETVVKERPVLMKRDPVLHKYGIQGFQPVLVEGKAIQVHPLVCGGLGADFDGDTMAITVPVSKEAVEEAKRMFPSRNLFSPSTGGVAFVPNQESLLGLHMLTKWGKSTGKTFETVDALKQASTLGDVHVNDVVKIKGTPGDKETTLGRIMIAQTLPSGFSSNSDILHNPSYEINKKSLKTLVDTLARKHTSVFPEHIDKLKNLGYAQSFKLAPSFGLADIAPIKERGLILGEANRLAEEARKDIKDRKALEKRLISIYEDATAKIDAAYKANFTESGNKLGMMIYSGSRGDVGQLRQMVAAPMLMQSSLGKVLPTPVTKAYSEGLDIGEYWMTQHGARKGMVQKGVGTSEPGALSKEIINSNISTVITAKDCGTHQGILLPIDNPDAHDRFLVADYKLKDGSVVKSGTLLDSTVGAKLRDAQEKKVMVRSPMKCEEAHGVCQMCVGLSEYGKLYPLGTNIGVLASQAMGEPTTQMSMKDFHTGGITTAGGKATAGASSFSMLHRLKSLIKMPQTLKDSATVSTRAGKVEKVTKDASGGVDIWVGGVKHYVPEPLVNDEIKPGYEVKRVGDPLSHGPINPHELLKATGDIHAVQNYLADSIHDMYASDGTRRRNIEVVVRSLTNTSKVKDPGHSGYSPGDVVNRSVLESYNRNLPKLFTPVTHEPHLRGVNEIPLLGSQDWMARLNFQRLPDTLQQAAAEGWKSDLHGLHPIPSMMAGSEFGKPPPSKPAHHY